MPFQLRSSVHYCGKKLRAMHGDNRGTVDLSLVEVNDGTPSPAVTLTAIDVDLIPTIVRQLIEVYLQARGGDVKDSPLHMNQYLFIRSKALQESLGMPGDKKA